ncbi:hypothetical protein [Acetoanaerobium sticklandii]|uniref:hypothetical protein n=1 Tax=Acetoanaerobium sticklandii TaxID=1511 RepID=UPI003A8E0B3B
MTFAGILSFLWNSAFQILGVTIPLGDYNPSLLQLALGFMLFSLIWYFLKSIIS